MKKRILFVDDEPMCLQGFALMLREYKDVWELDFAQGAGEAAQKVLAADFDAVVSDYRMPGKNGFDLLTELRAQDKTKDIPFTIVTGVGDDRLKREALELGATDLLSKPVAPEDLIARIRNMLALKSYQDAMKAQNEILDQRVRERTAELEASRLDIIWRLAKAGEYRDEETGRHVARVGWYCRMLAAAMGSDPRFTDLIFLTSPLHDIGKIGIPDRILLKPGKLALDERMIMERHCLIGARILQEDPKTLDLFAAEPAVHALGREGAPSNPLLEMATVIALGHHERWDGAGYPQGLAGEAIPLASRIAALADVYDALISARPYKPAYPVEEALAIVREESGRHFDPAVCEAFEKTREELASVAARYADSAPAPDAALIWRRLCEEVGKEVTRDD